MCAFRCKHRHVYEQFIDESVATVASQVWSLSHVLYCGEILETRICLWRVLLASKTDKSFKQNKRKKIKFMRQAVVLLVQVPYPLQ